MIQVEMDGKRGSKTKLETEKKMKTDQVRSNTQEVKDINQKLSDVEVSAGKLKDIDSDLKRAVRSFCYMSDFLFVHPPKYQCPYTAQRAPGHMSIDPFTIG